MPSTITTYNVFVPNTKARSSQVNENFANYRGDLLPINTDTATASDLTHNIGKGEHRWLGVLCQHVDFRTSTSTAGLILRGDTALTTGAFVFQINSVTVARVTPSGFDVLYLSGSITAQTFTANGSFTVPAGVTKLFIEGCGGGGGGGGGGGYLAAPSNPVGESGEGGEGAPILSFSVNCVAGDVLSITVSGGGGGGAGGSASGTAGGVGTDGVASSITGSGIALTFFGGRGGKGGHGEAGGDTSTAGATGSRGGSCYALGGAGGTFTASGTAAAVNTGSGGGGGGASGGAGASGGSARITIRYVS